LGHDQAGRVAHALTHEPPGELHLLDAAQMIGASQLDRLCGYAVALLNRAGQRCGQLLNLVGVLDPDRICGIYFAVSASRRDRLRRDPVWGYHVQQVEAEMPEALNGLRTLVERTPTSEVGYALARFDIQVGAAAE
jgi:hypothetical protein